MYIAEKEHWQAYTVSIAEKEHWLAYTVDIAEKEHWLAYTVYIGLARLEFHTFERAFLIYWKCNIKYS